MGESVYTIRKNEKPVVDAGKEIGLEVNAVTTKYMFMSRDQNAGRSQYINIDNSSFERVEELKENWYQSQRIKILFRKKLRAE